MIKAVAKVVGYNELAATSILTVAWDDNFGVQH
jgi:hypothetical protein